MTETRRDTTVENQSRRTEAGSNGWVGWIMFAGTMMVMIGVFHLLQGLVALFQSDYYLVGTQGLTVHVTFTTWGWTHIILGALVVAAGFALIAEQTWARVVVTLLCFASAIVNIGFLAAYPVWSTMMIALDVLVIWAVTVHGREMKSIES